ncbi:MAG: N-acetylmuramoyl-L-alanine amidase [Phycisphaerales bacterium]|nr:N-acetylmuramoyl-L-alanine amidase [Phycisphaerales bacterium]
MNELNRRDLIRAAAGLGGMLLLGGCQSAARRPRVAASTTPTPNPADWEFHPVAPKWISGGGGDAVATVPGVIPRANWTKARPNLPDTNPMNGVSRITVHHDGMTAFTSTSQAAASQRLESIRRAHVNANGWADIGYHYVVDPAGRVWEARPISLQGAHVKDNNEHNLGIMMLGNYDEQAPTTAATKSLDDFVAAMMRKYRVSVSRVYTHQEIRPTACPGTSLQRFMLSARSRGGALARA